jgi:4-amino-4-deoxy-L-arabinose transferase-like glycosyltransferase
MEAVPPAPRRRVLLLVAAGALLLRLLVPAARGIERHHEGGYDFYVEMADHLLAGEGLHRTLPYGQGDRFAIRTPLYPLALAAMRLLPGPLPWLVALLGAVAGATTVLLAGLAASRIFGARSGLAAAVAAALWPHAVIHDTALQDTALYAALFGGVLVLHLRLVRPRAGERAVAPALAAGVLGGLAVLTRVALLPSVVCLIAWTALVRRDRRLVLAGVGLGALSLVLAPWLARNATRIGAPVLTSDTGRSLWLGNNPETFSVYPRASIDRAEERAWAALPETARAGVRDLADDELAQDAWFRGQALDWIIANPAAAAVGGLRKAAATFSPWFNPRGSPAKQVVHLLTWTPAAILAVGAAWRQRRRWRELGPVGLSLLLLAAQSAVFFGHSAYRLYLDPWVLVVASGWLARREGSGA